jgi:hypothetical protein
MSLSKQRQQGSRGPNPFGPCLGYDHATPAPKKESIITNHRVELPSADYKLDSTHLSTDLVTEDSSLRHLVLPLG